LINRPVLREHNEATISTASDAALMFPCIATRNQQGALHVIAYPFSFPILPAPKRNLSPRSSSLAKGQGL
jgi:hypothetical protein